MQSATHTLHVQSPPFSASFGEQTTFMAEFILVQLFMVYLTTLCHIQRPTVRLVNKLERMSKEAVVT
jgi:hypothetical protein